MFWTCTLPVYAALALNCFPLIIRAQTKAATNPDADCLACHSQKDLRSAAGKSVFVDEARHKASVHSVLSRTDCHTTIKGFPHPAQIASVNCATCHADEAADLPKSVHSVLGSDACTSCHASGTRRPAGCRTSSPAYVPNVTAMK